MTTPHTFPTVGLRQMWSLSTAPGLSSYWEELQPAAGRRRGSSSPPWPGSRCEISPAGSGRRDRQPHGAGGGEGRGGEGREGERRGREGRGGEQRGGEGRGGEGRGAEGRGGEGREEGKTGIYVSEYRNLVLIFQNQ